MNNYPPGVTGFEPEINPPGPKKKPAKKPSFKVQLEPGVWLADGEGDPARTLDEKNAKEFKTITSAVKALCKAREYRPFPKAVIVS